MLHELMCADPKITFPLKNCLQFLCVFSLNVVFLSRDWKVTQMLAVRNAAGEVTPTARQEGREKMRVAVDLRVQDWLMWLSWRYIYGDMIICMYMYINTNTFELGYNPYKYCSIFLHLWMGLIKIPGYTHSYTMFILLKSGL